MGVKLMVDFIKMPVVEFEDYKNFCIDHYTVTYSNNLRVSLEQAHEISKRQINSMLSNGLNTKNHYLFNIVDKTLNEKIGTLWICIREKQGDGYICDIHIDETYQGKGYGKRTMRKIEEFLQEKGVYKAELDVFGDNKTAFELYKKMGYEIQAISMIKEF
jgi:ribosomal protein S18 acetylase RimI-like enzyme